MSEGDERGEQYLPRKSWRAVAFHETYKSQVSLVQDAFKLLGLANGGAAVTLVTLIGAKEGGFAGSTNLTYAIASFCSGLVATIGSYFFGYFTRMVFLKYLDTEERRFLRIHIGSFFIASFLIFLGTIFFVSGVVFAGSAFDPSIFKFTEQLAD